MNQQNVWQKYILDNQVALEKLFASNGWKKALLPWMKAQREIKLRTVLEGKDQDARDVSRGLVLAFEQLVNLPEAIVASKQLAAQEQAEPEQGTTDYADSIYFEEND